MSRRRRDHQGRVRELLLAAVSLERSDADVANLLKDVDPDALIKLARHHRVASLLHDRLGSIHDVGPSPLAAQLRLEYLSARASQLHVYRTIATLREAINIPFLILKGPALAAAWYEDPSLRMYVDLDVLVRRSDFRKSLDALTSAGFTHLLPSWDGLFARGMAEVPMNHKACTVDLHWHLIARAQPRREIHLDERALFERARPITLGSVEVNTLGCEDTLLHLCINCGLDGGRRLQQLVDVDRVTRSGRIDWSAFTDRGREAQAHALCAAVLQRCHDMLGTPLPRGLLRRLAPYPGWLYANALINRRRRSDRRLTNGITSGLLLASGRAKPTTTTRSLMRAVHEASRDRVRMLVPRRGGPFGVPSDDEDARSREQYLAWVEDNAA
jgi:hypothetical protein